MTSIIAFLDDLNCILNHELKAYQRLLSLVRRERSILQEEDFTHLEAITLEKEALADTLLQWEQSRKEVCGRLAEELGPSANIIMFDLMNRLDESELLLLEETNNKLSTLRREFAELVEQLLPISQGNHPMLQTGLTRVNATFDFLASLRVSSSGSYTSHDRSQSR